MGISYRQGLGGNKRLNEIVFAGSHDASITKGSANAQTQDLNIAGQADAGVRLFDLRILARAVGKRDTQMVGYHGSPGGKVTRDINSTITDKDYTLQANKSITGEFGLPLVQMLKQAKKFVKDTDEFLIFKFDKSTNYEIIADYCCDLLGKYIYKPIDKEFSRLTLNDLAAKVVCVFSDKARTEQIKNHNEDDGILGFRSLRGEKNSVGTYKENYKGLQYFGKGGTNALSFWLTNKKKREDNEGIQEKIMMAMARGRGRLRRKGPRDDVLDIDRFDLEHSGEKQDDVEQDRRPGHGDPVGGLPESRRPDADGARYDPIPEIRRRAAHEGLFPEHRDDRLRRRGQVRRDLRPEPCRRPDVDGGLQQVHR